MTKHTSDNHLVLFPREYNQRGEDDRHSVLGVTPDGKTVNVKLRLDPAFQDKEGAPRIREFARTDLKAKQACLASPDNSPDNREGVLLFSRVEKDRTSRGSVDTYIARWAVVLAEDADSPSPVFGIGRIMIDHDTPILIAARARLKRLEAFGRGDSEEAQQVRAALEDRTLFGYPVLLYLEEEQQEFAVEDADSLMQCVSKTIDKHSKDGVLGGVLLRAVCHTGLIPGSCVELFPKFIPAEFRYQQGEEVAATLPEPPEGATTWLVMPIRRIACGTAGSRYYGQPKRFRWLEKTFGAEGEVPRLCQLVVRTQISGDPHALLASGVFPLKDPEHTLLTLNAPPVSADRQTPLPGAQIVPVGQIGEPYIQRATWLFSKRTSERPVLVELDKSLSIEEREEHQPSSTLETEPVIQQLAEQSENSNSPRLTGMAAVLARRRSR